MSAEIFIKGCKSQLHWLSYNLQFLDKYFEPMHKVVVLDPDCQEIVKHWGVKDVSYYYEIPWPDPYMHALWCKATADWWTGAELILLMDCDTLLLQPARLLDLMREGKPIIQTEEWKYRPDAFARWHELVKRTTGIDPEVDYMVSRPWLFWRETFLGARELVEKQLGANFTEAVYSTQPYDWTQYATRPMTFCDLENLGLYAAKFEPERYAIFDARGDSYVSPFSDLWSHTDFTPELRGKLDDSLSAAV